MKQSVGKITIITGTASIICFLLGIGVTHWFIAQQPSTLATPVAQLPPPPAPTTLSVPSLPPQPQAVQQMEEELAAIIDLQANIEALESELYACQQTFVELEQEAEWKLEKQKMQPFMKDAAKRRFIFEHQLGIGPEQMMQMAQFMRNYTGPREELSQALEAFQQTIFTSEQLEGMKNLGDNMEHSHRTRNATEGLSELQTLFDLSEDKADEIYTKLYDSLIPMPTPFEGPNPTDEISSKLALFEGILDEEQLNVYRQYLEKVSLSQDLGF